MNVIEHTRASYALGVTPLPIQVTVYVVKDTGYAKTNTQFGYSKLNWMIKML